MTVQAPSRRERMRQSVGPFRAFFEGPYARLDGQADVANFAVGNPHEMALPGLVSAMRSHLEPRDPDWFGYKLSEPEAQRTVAQTLSRRTGMDWDPADVAMTNGGFAAISVALRTLLEPGDEVVFLSPPWFFYELLILAAGGEPVRVPLEPPAFEPDVDAIEVAIGPRTRAVLINSPHNPSGRVYPESFFAALAERLAVVSARVGRPVWIISDEPYYRIVFDGGAASTPATHHPHTMITYSYGKTLLAPGQRVGYLTVPPTLPERADLRAEVFLQQLAAGWSFPNALLQHSLPDLEPISIDVGALQRRRDRLVPALRDLGYETTWPEGTFYVMARSPLADDMAFADVLARHRVLVLPGTVVEVPGWFRISLTASDAMVEDGIPRFAAALDEARRGPG